MLIHGPTVAHTVRRALHHTQAMIGKTTHEVEELLAIANVARMKWKGVEEKEMELEGGHPEAGKGAN